MKESPCAMCKAKSCVGWCSKWVEWYTRESTIIKISYDLKKTGLLDEFRSRKKGMGLK